MKIITISREFGSGGREIGKRLSDYLDYDYYDSEIISMVAQKSGFGEEYVESTLTNHNWKNQNITFCSTLGSKAYIQASKINLLIEQKKVIEEIASLGKSCVIVGRNADVILREYEPFNIFVCAQTQSKINRCKERAGEGEKLSDEELLRKMKRIDKVRSETREIMTGSSWGQRDAYHLTVNTTGWNIKEIVPAVANFAMCRFGGEK